VLPLRLPGIQLKLTAPEPLSVVELPAQRFVDPLTLTTGTVLTRTVTVEVETHPVADVPVTVYVVLEDGVTVAELPEIFPGIQL
jgi:hypothetical protein